MDSALYRKMPPSHRQNVREVRDGMVVAISEGRRAALVGCAPGDNPHRRGSEDFDWWRQGWDIGDRERRR